MGPTALLPLRRKACYGFYHLKIHRPRPGLNPRTLGPVASTLTTRPPRATTSSVSCGQNGNAYSPDDGGGDGLRNVRLLSTTDTTCFPIRFYKFQSLWKLRVLYKNLLVFVEEHRLCSSHLGLNIRLSNLISNTNKLCSSLNLEDQVSCPYDKLEIQIRTHYFTLWFSE
jgi:hypothetical protein